MNKTIFLMLLLCSIKSFPSIITTLNKTDPEPIFSSSFPYDYLYVNEKEYMKGRTNYVDPLRFSFGMSPFYQRADSGKDLNGSRCQLGDISGKWNMLAFLPYGNAQTTTQPDLPAGKSFPSIMLDARDNLLDCINSAYNYNGGSGAPTDPSGATLPIPDQLTTTQGLVSLQDTGRKAKQELSLSKTQLESKIKSLKENIPSYNKLSDKQLEEFKQKLRNIGKEINL